MAETAFVTAPVAAVVAIDFDRLHLTLGIVIFFGTGFVALADYLG
jgi:hypothetical protein